MNKHNYKVDALFGDLSEEKYVRFLEHYNDINDDKNKLIIRLGYTTTIQEVIEQIKNRTLIDDVSDKIINKLNNNYNRLVEFYRNNWELEKRFRKIEQIDIFENLEKKLKIKDNKIQLDIRIQTLGIDIIEVNQDTEEIKFIEVKSFKVINKMYDKLGIEYWSNFNNKTLGFTFTMLCDEVVYAQDIHPDITNKNKRKSLIKIDEGRENGNFDVETVYNIFNYLEYLNVTKEEVNKFNEKEINFIVSKTNNTLSNFLLIDYDKFKKVKETVVYKYFNYDSYLRSI